MNENFDEISKSFKEFIKLDQPMSPQEAIEKLSAFHKTSAENILVAFPNLKFSLEKPEEGETIKFEETVNSGYPCISIKTYNKNGEFIRSELINEFTGQPQAKCG